MFIISRLYICRELEKIKSLSKEIYNFFDCFCTEIIKTKRPRAYEISMNIKHRCLVFYFVPNVPVTSSSVNIHEMINKSVHLSSRFRTAGFCKRRSAFSTVTSNKLYSLCNDFFTTKSSRVHSFSNFKVRFDF